MSRLRSNLWRLSGLMLLAVAPCGISRAARATVPSRSIKLVPPAVAIIPPADAAITVWPLVLPCRDPRAFNWEGSLQGVLFWSNVSGDKQLSFSQEFANDTLTLPASLPGGSLERLWVSTGPLPEGLGLDCTVPDSYDGQHSIEWSKISPSGQAAVSVSYTIAFMPSGWRLQRWIVPWYSGPATDPHSRFLSQIGWQRKNLGDVSAPSIGLTRDALSDLRDAIAVACKGRHCASALQSFASVILEVIRAPKPRYERLDRETGEVEPLGHTYEWRVSTETAEVRVGCNDIWASSSQILCELTLTTSAGAVLHYDAFRLEIQLANPSGLIEFVQREHGVVRVTISGAALALRAVPDVSETK